LKTTFDSHTHGARFIHHTAPVGMHQLIKSTLVSFFQQTLTLASE
jgi:hypothetical protein